MPRSSSSRKRLTLAYTTKSINISASNGDDHAGQSSLSFVLFELHILFEILHMSEVVVMFGGRSRRAESGTFADRGEWMERSAELTYPAHDGGAHKWW
jgi:hypothetical protein